MRFTPNYRVSYHGRFFAAGQSFSIDPADAEEMRQHGTVEESVPPEAIEPDVLEPESVPPEADGTPVKKAGRPKKEKGVAP